MLEEEGVNSDVKSATSEAIANSGGSDSGAGENGSNNSEMANGIYSHNENGTFENGGEDNYVNDYINGIGENGNESNEYNINIEALSSNEGEFQQQPQLYVTECDQNGNGVEESDSSLLSVAGNALAKLQQQQQQAITVSGAPQSNPSAFSPVIPLLPIDANGFDGQNGSSIDSSVLLGLPDASDFPLAKLRLYLSEVTNDRQAAATALSDAVQLVTTDADLDLFLTATARLASDDEGSVRAEVAQRLVNLITYCHKQLPESHVLQGVARSHLIPILLHLVHDTHAQIRRTAEDGLVVVVDESVLQPQEIQSLVCPIICDLAEALGDDERLEAVLLIGRILSRLLRNPSSIAIVRFRLLPVFLHLCADSVCQVRRACAQSFADIVQALGCDSAESLLDHYLTLCGDSIWNVRRSAAEGFVIIGQSVCAHTRLTRLTPALCALLNDAHRSVIDAAYQVLGPFIHTFQDPTRTGFILTQDGGIVYDPAIILHPTGSCNVSQCSSGSKRTPPTSCCQDETNNKIASNSSNNNDNSDSSDSENFNSLLYWRVPLPDLEDNNNNNNTEKQPAPTISTTQTLDNPTTPATNGEMNGHVDGLVSSMNCLTIGTGNHAAGGHATVDDADSGHPASDSPRSDASPRASSEQEHDPEAKTPPGVGSRGSPQADIDHDENLDDDGKVTETIGACPAVLFDLFLRPPPDDTASFYCAHSLPAVAITVGRAGWPRLRELYEMLASHQQWRVRWTLACSVAVLAQIVGDSATLESLKPIYDAHLRDVDEVRIGGLRNFNRFIGHLPPGSVRDEYLLRVPLLLSTDNPNNWRLRYEVGRQMADSCELFSPDIVVTQGVQIALQLQADKAYVVRQSACRFFAKIVHRACYPVVGLPITAAASSSTSSSSSSSNLSDILSQQQQQSPHASLPKLLENISQMAQSPNASQRVLFIWLCRWIAYERSIPPSVYTRHLLPTILTLSGDLILAVRIALSRLLSQHIMSVAYFTSTSNPHCDWLSEVLEKLRNDPYADVRNGLSLLPGALISEYQMPPHP